jgi:hypothetical protein
MNQIAKLAIPLLSFGLGLFGCGRAEEPIVEATPVVATQVNGAASPEPPAAARPANTPDVAESQKASAVVAFTPPFPQRTELFEPPQRASNAARRDDESGETVELKGFIHVDEPLVVLSIDGVISSIPEGGEKYGVQVISIEPPTVVLKRGGRPWPATLE